MSVNIPDLPSNVEVTEVDGTSVVDVIGSVNGLAITAEGSVEVQSSGTVKNLTVEQEGSSPLNLTLDAIETAPAGASAKADGPGVFKKATITGGKKGDSVKFSGKTTVQRSSLDMGKGADTVTFGGKTQFVGKSTLDLGPAGGKADKVIFKGRNTAEGGKVVIENFDSKDKLLLNGEVLKQSDLEDGKTIDGTSIKIEFAD